MRSLAAAAVLVLLAGCTVPSDPTTTAQAPGTRQGVVLDKDTYSVSLSQVASMYAPGQNFTVRVEIQGTPVVHTDHIGAHIGTAATTPSTTAYAVACTHQDGNLPNAYFVNCRAPLGEGTFHIRGHARATSADGTVVDWWSADQSFDVMTM